MLFIFLIGYINVNKGVFCLIISYLRIKSYNILNYNNCSTDWSFPLRILITLWYLEILLQKSNIKILERNKFDTSNAKISGLVQTLQ
jgi:hypothetical protein